VFTDDFIAFLFFGYAVAFYYFFNSLVERQDIIREEVDEIIDQIALELHRLRREISDLKDGKK
jgi:pilus assembly protein TadC